MSLLRAGFIWNFIRTILERGLLFIQQIVLAWILIPETFGYFSSLSSLLAVCSLFSFTGINQIMTNRFKAHILWLPFINAAYYSLILFSFILFNTLAIVNHGYEMKDILLILIYSLSLPFIALKGIDSVKLNIIGSYAYVSMARVFYSITLVVVSILLAVLGFDILSLILAATIASIIEFLILRKKTKFSFSFSRHWPSIKKLFFNSLKLVGFNLSWRLIFFLDFILIGILLGDKKAGLYFMAFNLSVQPLSLLVSYLPSVLFSSNIRDELTIEFTYLRVQKVTLFLIFLSTPIFISLYFYADVIISVLFNNEWDGLGPLLQILSLAMIPRALSSQWYLGHLVKEKYSLMSKFSIYYLGLFLILFLSGSYFFDLKGAVFSILIFYFSTLFLSKESIFKNNPYLKETLLMIIYGILCFYLVKYFIHFNQVFVNLVFSLVISFTLYFLIVYLTCLKAKKLVFESLLSRKS